MLSLSTKQFSVMVPKQTIGCFHESIGCFGFDSKSTIKQFSTFSKKTPKYKTIGCFNKKTGCFSLSLKNTFLLKRLRMPMLWIQSRVDYILNVPQILSKRQHSNNKHNQPFIILQRVWILQSLNPLGSTISPYLMKTNP